MNAHMKAVIAQQAGPASILQLTDCLKPELKHADDVLVSVKAASVNPLDAKLRSGSYPMEFPAILGCDAAGIVEAVGTAVTQFKPGDRVCYFYGGLNQLPGNYAEYNSVPELNLIKIPDTIDFVQAAAAPLACLTAWEALFDRTTITTGSTVLIHAGAGGVGHIAIQLAKHSGAQVATTVGSEEKAQWAKSLGADHVINYKKSNFVDSILEWTQGEGVDVVMDNVGGTIIEQSFPAIKFYGDLVTLLIAPMDTDWSVARFRNIRFIQEVMLTPLLFGLKQWQRHQSKIIAQCITLMQKNALNIHVSKIYEFNQISQAHEKIESGRTQGKLVIKIE